MKHLKPFKIFESLARPTRLRNHIPLSPEDKEEFDNHQENNTFVGEYQKLVKSNLPPRLLKQPIYDLIKKYNEDMWGLLLLTINTRRPLGGRMGATTDIARRNECDMIVIEYLDENFPEWKDEAKASEERAKSRPSDYYDKK